MFSSDSQRKKCQKQKIKAFRVLSALINGQASNGEWARGSGTERAWSEQRELQREQNKDEEVECETKRQSWHCGVMWMCCWLCLVAAALFVVVVAVVVVMPQSLFSTFPMQRHAEFEQLSWLSNGRTPGLAWDTPLHVKDKRVFNYSSCYFHNSPWLTFQSLLVGCLHSSQFNNPAILRFANVSMLQNRCHSEAFNGALKSDCPSARRPGPSARFSEAHKFNFRAMNSNSINSTELTCAPSSGIWVH